MLRFFTTPIASSFARPLLTSASANAIIKPTTFAIFNRALTTTKTTDEKKAKAVAAKQTKEKKNKIASLKKKLTKETANLKALKKKLTQTEKKDTELIKTRKQKEKEHQKSQLKKEQTILNKAIKPVYKITAYNAYVKEKVSNVFTITDAARTFKSLSDTEKADYQKKADEYNTKAAQLFKPKPKVPANGFARFVQQHFQAQYAATNQDNYAAFKNISEEWKKLSDSQKAAYKPPSSVFTEYSKAITAWKADRVKAYKSQL